MCANCESINEHRVVAEVRVRELSRIADGLLQQRDGLDAATVAAMRNEVTQVFALCYEITEALARGDVPTAYCISCGDDVGGTSLGLTA